jgi:RHS repeat-associated protein
VANRLTKITNSADAKAVSYTYDNANRMTKETLPNTTATTFNYDGMNRLKQLKDVKGTTTLFDRNYTYNTANQISQIAETAQTRNFGYDNLDRLTSVTGSTSENYTFDGVGNRTSSHLSASYNYQPFNRLTNTATTSYVYNSNGNMTQKTVGANTTQFYWDYENRLKQVILPNSQNVVYKYDALGRRSERNVNNSTSWTKFTYDGGDVILDQNSDGTSITYLNGLGIDNKIRQTVNGQAQYFLSDHLGSTTALTDATGVVIASTNYDSFGNATNASFPTRYQYTGREFDSLTGLHYYRNRWYDANLGRFISEDPIGFRGGDVNLYGYVRNSPTNSFDPFGLDVVAMYNRQGHTNSEGAAEGSLLILDFGGGLFDPIVRVHSYDGGIFSGKEGCTNKTTCDADENLGPVPAGNYLIGEGLNVPGFNNTIGYPLYKSRDGSLEGPFGLQQIPVKDPLTGKETIRAGGFYIHAGRLSLGCITFRAEQNRGEPGYPSNQRFNDLDNILRKTPPMYYNNQKFKGRLIVF